MVQVIKVSDIVGAAREFMFSVRGPQENWDGMSDTDLEARINTITGKYDPKVANSLSAAVSTMPAPPKKILVGGIRKR